MKKTLLISMLLCAMICGAQGPQTLVNVQYDSWPGATVKGWLYLPADYNTSTKKYPVVFFYHGVGEAGSDPYVLLNNGIPNLIANGMRPDNITNPSDGQQYSFIVVSVQHWSWSPNPTWLPYELEWLKSNYRVDTSRVYVTGLSAGGKESYSAAIVNENVSRLVAASVPMSPAQVWPYDPTLVGQNQIHTWFFAGNADGTYTNNAINYSNDCNTLLPGSSQVNLYPGGHCCWNSYYNTTWHDPNTGLSIWEWMLTNQKAANTVQPLPVNFLSLDVQKDWNGARLSWKIEAQVNVQQYEVEKSVDGRRYTRVGVVAATDASQYSFTDQMVSGKTWYRIKSVDQDGRYKYSSIIIYNSGDSRVEIKAFPLPVQQELTLQHPAATASSRIMVHAVDGRLVKSVKTNAGTQQTIIDCSQLVKGTYFVKYDDGRGGGETLKITKG